MTRLDFLVNRLRHLTDTLGTLRERVREAVATELGKAVGQAVQDLLHAFARGRPVFPDPATAPQSRSSRSSREGEEDPDPWDEDEQVAARRQAVSSDESEPDAVEPVPRPNRGPAAVGVATRVWTWWRTKSGPAWVGVGLGLVAGAAAWTGGPLLTAGLALAGTAVDLLATGVPSSAILGP